MPLRLALYSDQIAPVTDPIDRFLLEWLPRSGGTIGYIPSSPDPERAWLSALARYYDRYGLELMFFGLEDEFDASRLGALLSCDAIHLTGGNTFRFLYWLQARELMDEIRNYANSGGVLIGVSAGAILMTPDISTSALCGDVAYPGLTDTKGLALVDFAIVPHFDRSEELAAEAASYASRFKGTVYAVPDGAGIVVDGEICRIVGQVQAFEPINETRP
jgi:dipeptidase E